MEIALSLFTLVLLEIVLGIDNLVFIAIAANGLPKKQQKPARFFGLMLALVMRLIFLGALVWIAGLTKPLFTLYDLTFSGRDILLFGGGLFLLWKGTSELHLTIDNPDFGTQKLRATFFAVIVQIIILDFIFSFDSVLTAIGLANEYWVMATAVIIAMIVMAFASNPLSALIDAYPSIKLLALSFILMIGMILCADGLHFHVPRGYVYFSMTFSIFVEILNILAGRRKRPAA